MAHSKHPRQPLVWGEDGIVRFKRNDIICWLVSSGRLDFNEIATKNFSIEDQAQLAQLIGYSVAGYGDLPYVKRKDLRKCDKLATAMIKKRFPHL